MLEIFGNIVRIFAPIFFVVNIPLALLSGIWIACTGGLLLVLCVLGAHVCAPICMMIVMMLVIGPIGLIQEKMGHGAFILLTSLMALFIWGLASVWGYVVITTLVIWGISLDLNMIPIAILCLSTTAAPYFRTLTGWTPINAESELRGMLLFAVSVSIELASAMPLTMFLLSGSRLSEIRSHILAGYLAYGVLAVPVIYKFLSALEDISREHERGHEEL
ncbi:MAG: hypothetical protein IJR14_08235 [Synergistaceae bacterium]|nr:hypothetical protein [Synergistaceae bacterium]